MGKIPTNLDFDELDDTYGGIQPIKKTQNTNGIYKKDPYDENIYESQREHTRGRKGDTYISKRTKARS